MTAFGTIFAYKASRTTAESEDPVLDFDRIASNQRRGIETNFVADTNLMIQVDEALDAARPATDVTLRDLGLLEWVTFLRECGKRGLHYAFSPFFAYAEMPAKYAQLRAARLQKFSEKFGLLWADDEISVTDVSVLGREDMTFEGLSEHHQMLMAISFSTLLLMLTVQRDGADFSVHRRKPWRVFERLHNLAPDFKDVGGSNCSIERHFRHWVAGQDIGWNVWNGHKEKSARYRCI